VELVKGQFMLISSIVIGFIVISAASTISEVQERSFESDDTRDTVEMIKNSAEEVDHSDRREVENFINMVSSITGYQTTTEKLQGQSCFNITLISSKTEVNLNCSQTKSEYSGSSGDSDNSGDSNNTFLVDDFEEDTLSTASGNWSDWAGDTGNFTPSSTATIDSGNSGYILANGEGVSVASGDRRVHTKRTAPTNQDVSFYIQRSRSTDNQYEESRAWVMDGTKVVVVFELEDSDTMKLNGDSNDGGWSESETYYVELSLDFNNDEVKYNITNEDTGSTVFKGTTGFQNSANSWDRFEFSSDNDKDNEDTYTYLDTIKTG